MPIFELDKLVRDGFREEYTKCEQVAQTMDLSPDELCAALAKKVAEEAREIETYAETAKIIGEIADLQQAIGDLIEKCGITPEEVEAERIKRFKRLGGFASGFYVTYLELKDGDPWIEYYRERPDLFPEVK